MAITGSVLDKLPDHQKTFAQSRIQGTTQQRVFAEQYDDEDREVLIQHFQHLNGHFDEFMSLSVAQQKNQLVEIKQNLLKNKNAAPKDVVSPISTSNDMFVRLIFAPSFVRHFFGLSEEVTKNYPETKVALNEHYKAFRDAFLTSFYNVVGIEDVTIKREVEELALRTVYNGMFDILPCVGSTFMVISLATTVANAYRKTIYNLSPSMKDHEVKALQAQKKEKVLSDTAQGFSTLTGMKVEELKKQIELNLEPILSDLLIQITAVGE